MNLQTVLGLAKPPVAIAYLNEPPLGVSAWQGSAVPASCSFWKKAQEGHVFYTTPADNLNCAIGAYTQKIPLPMDRSGELEGTIGFMVESGYIAMEEVPGIPTLQTEPAVIAFAPAHLAPFSPSVVVVTAQPYQAMLLYETALQAKIASATVPTLGRPACAALPLSLQTQSAALSLGCKGNRTFSGVADDEMYVVIPGASWPALLEQLAATTGANNTMETHYQQHKAQFADV